MLAIVISHEQAFVSSVQMPDDLEGKQDAIHAFLADHYGKSVDLYDTLLIVKDDTVIGHADNDGIALVYDEF